MKKNFLKKLAFTMAFATVFTTLAPAAGVFAASKPSLNVGKKLTLLLGTEREEFDINVKNKVSGSKYEWTTSNKKVATVDKAGVVEGQAVGSAKVTLKITLPTKKTATLSTTVDVKDNIKEVAINNAPKEALKVGQEYDFNRTIVETFGGNTKAHKGAVTRWFLNDTKTATINDSGVFVATEAGEYEVTAKSFQSVAKYNEYLKSADEKLVTATSETVKVTVKTSLVDVKLLTPNKVELTFDSSVKDVVKAAADVKIETVATNKVVYPIKGTPVVSADGKTVVVESYQEFVNATTYKVSALNSSVEFTAQIGAIKEIVIDNQTVAPVLADLSNLKTLSYKVLDIYGVDVTSKYPLSGRMTLSSSSTNASYVAADGKLYLFNKGDVVSVQLTYVQYDTTTGQDTSVKSNVATITAVESVPATTSTWTIAASNASNPFEKTTTSVAAKDETKTLYVKVKDNYGAEHVNVGVKFTSLDTTILLVDSSTGKLYPQKAGTVVVKVEKGGYVDYLTITVNPEQVSTRLNPETISYTLSNSTNLGALDSKAYKFTLVDNYEQTNTKFTGTGSIKALSGTDAVTVNGSALATDATINTIAFTNGVATINFTAVAGKTGTGSYLVTADGKTAVVFVNVVAPTGSVGYKVELSDSELDSFNNNTPETAVISLYSIDAAGVKAAKLNTVSGTAITYTVKDAAGTTKASGTFTGANVVSSAGLANGTYTVIVSVGPVNASTTFTVKSTKLGATVVVDKITTTYAESSTILAAIQNTLTAKVDGTAVADSAISVVAADYIVLNTNAVTSGGAINFATETQLPIYIKQVTVTHNLVVYTVEVGTVITINKQ